MYQAEVGDRFRETRYVDIDRARVCYRKAGEGPALVFLHGFPLAGFTWRKVVPDLAKHFTCYAFDLIGLGQSTSPDATDFASPGQARIFRQALRAEGIESYALTGNDTGGWIARELALLEPERVTHLALTNTEIPGHRPPWIPIYQRLVRLPGSSFVISRMLASRRLRRSPLGFGGCFADHRLIEGEFADEFVSPLRSSPERLAGMFRFLEQMKFERMDQFAGLHGKLSMPVAFLWASADPTFPVETARAMTSQFPNVAHFRTIENAKLFVHEEQPAAVAAWLMEFLTSGALTLGIAGDHASLDV